MKIFLAGTFSEQKNAETIKQSKYLLESFYYIKPWQAELMQSAKEFVLDSGAFSFMQDEKKTVNWEEYANRYADFINEYDIKLYIELDLDYIIGVERSRELRKLLENKTGKKAIPVWHKIRGKQEFFDMCEQYEYVALGGIVGQRWKGVEQYFPWFIKEAHKRGARIHGLGYTKVSNLPKYHFDSVDSTRWNCSRFGRIEYFDGETMQTVDNRAKGKRVQNDKDANMFTFKEWVKFQEYAERNL